MAWNVSSNEAAGNVSLASFAKDGLNRDQPERFSPPHDVVTWAAHAAPLEALTFDPEGRRLATSDREGHVAVWEVATRRKLQAWQTGGTRVRALTFSPDGTRIACGTETGTLQLWDCATGKREQAWAGHCGLVLAIAFAPDGHRLVSAGADWRVRLWEPGQCQPAGEWTHSEWVNAVSFTPDGRQIASGSADLSLRIGRPEDQPRVEIGGAHAHWVTALAFVDGGRVLVSGGNDAALRFWDTDGGDELATWPSSFGPVHSLALTHDERFLVIGAAQGVRLIDLGTAAELIRQETPRRSSERLSRPLVAPAGGRGCTGCQPVPHSPC